MKKLIIFGGMLLAGATIFTSCDSTTSERIEEKADTIGNNLEGRIDNMDKNDAEDDAEFVREAYKANAMELHMLANGKTNGTNAELKSAARKMESDHKKVADELREYASKKNIQLDTADMKHDDDADDKKGADWDKEWIDDMVADHEKDVKKYEDEQDDVMDADLKAWIGKTLPTLREHLESSKKLQEKLNK